ncbi:MAG: hypothetical protein UMU04_01890 [Halanaerobiales bacterium]|nr:hypothetical protein [Halanaerobiales bacterium]
MREEYRVKAVNFAKEMLATIFVEIEEGCLKWHGYGKTDDIWDDQEIYETNIGKMKLIPVFKSSFEYEIEGIGELKAKLKWCE